MLVESTQIYLNKYNFAKDKEYQGVSLNTKVMKTKNKKDCC